MFWYIRLGWNVREASRSLLRIPKAAAIQFAPVPVVCVTESAGLPEDFSSVPGSLNNNLHFAEKMEIVVASSLCKTGYSMPR